MGQKPGFTPTGGAGPALTSVAEDLDRSRGLTEAVAITYLGQVGFIFQHRGVGIVIDPYLTYSVDEIADAPPGLWRRNYPPPIAPEQLRQADLVLCTHDHLDHTDPATLNGIASASPEAVFAGPRSAIEVMIGAGIPARRTRLLEAGVPFRFGDAVIEPVAAAHEDYELDAEGHYAHLSYIIRWAGSTFFHAGDTTAQEQLSSDLDPRRIDIGFLPINGRDAERHRQGILGNMNGAEAAAFAARHSFGLVVPTHFDLYSGNGASLADFVRELEALDPAPRFKAFRPGEQMLHLASS
jgi:L-ascorbate 6-phosphate lactonase